MTLRLLFLAALVGAAGCVSDTRRIADAATSHIYLEGAYEADCVNVPHVVGTSALDACLRRQKALDVLKHEAQASDAALSKGKGHLPKVARQRLRAAKKAAEAL